MVRVRLFVVWGSWILLLCGTTYARQKSSGGIQGFVVDQEFGDPIAGVQVLVVKTGKKLETDSEGKFLIKGLLPGAYVLVFSKDGYERLVKNKVVVTAGKLKELRVELKGSYVDLEEFVVQELVDFSPGSSDMLLDLRLESLSLMDAVGSDMISRSGASDAAGALRLVAGATVKDGKSAVIRGLPDRYVSTQLNGIRLPSADADKRVVELDQFPSSVLDSLRVSKTFMADQQGDASGGAVDVRLKGVPDEPFFFRYQFQLGKNSQVKSQGAFLTYEGGGLNLLGRGSDHSMQLDNLGSNWEGAVGVSNGTAQLDGKFVGTLGGSVDLGGDYKLGGMVNLFYEMESSYYDRGIDDSYWVTKPGGKMVPKAFQGSVKGEDFKTNLFDITNGSQAIQIGSMATFGLKGKNHSINLTYLYSKTAEDSATLAEDTRGKAYFFPDYDPDDRTTPGHDQPDAAPYLRLETIQYTERATGTFQVNGTHHFLLGDWPLFKMMDLDWSLSRSFAGNYQPDKRQFGSLWVPGRSVGPIVIPPTHSPFKPAANFSLGNLQRIWKRTREESDQAALNMKFLFEKGQDSGFFKSGFFTDRLKRRYDQDSFSNFGDNSSYAGKWKEFWSRSFPLENHPITESFEDVDYKGKQNLDAAYGMFHFPLSSWAGVSGGLRVERTRISVENQAEKDATWFPPGSVTRTKLNPGDADVSLSETNFLPAVSLSVNPWDPLTFRFSYSETIARPTFNELTPILQQEFLGGPVFIGNPNLNLSNLKNYDIRMDFSPEEGSLLSLSWFRKDLKNPIERVQRFGDFDFTTVTNYPKGRLQGWEIEARQDLGNLWRPLGGLRLGGNGTLLDTEVFLPKDEIAGFNLPNIQAPMTSRDMTGAPKSLYNLWLTYDWKKAGTKIGVFYTVQGDSLLAGATQSKGNFIPNVYGLSFSNLNVSVRQSLGASVFLKLQAKNLTNPKIKTVYRSRFLQGDQIKTVTRGGIDWSVSINGRIQL